MEISVHKACQKTYNHEGMILAYTCRGGDALQSIHKKTQSQVLRFDIKSNCLFCGKKMIENFIEKQKRITSVKT